MFTFARFFGVSSLALVAVVGCGTSSDDAADGEVTNQEVNASALRAVDITVSNKLTGESYEARSYPDDDLNGDGKTELYKAPVYFVYIDGKDAAGHAVHKEWKAPRFMPYYNPASHPDSSYSARGWINAGLSNVPRQLVPAYKPDYEVHNTFSPFGGAIVVKGSFYIHAGPDDITDNAWGSAGCVEVFGNFDDFKKDILTIAGASTANLNAGISQLVAARKLYVTYQQASAPNLRAAYVRQVSGDTEETPTGVPTADGLAADPANDPTTGEGDDFTETDAKHKAADRSGATNVQ